MEDDILIDNYLKGLLSKDENKSFLDRLESDFEFKEKFQLEEQLFHSLNESSWSFIDNNNSEVKDYVKLLKEDELITLKKTLEEANTEFNIKKRGGSRRFFYYLAAASIVVFIGFQFFFNQNISNQDLYNDYVALNDLPSFVSRSDGTDDLAEAQRLFENKKFEKAISIFQSKSNETKVIANVFIYQGIAQTELEKFDEAEETFNVLINSNLIDAEKGYWYKALLYLKQNRVEETKHILNEIVSNSLYNNEVAKELLYKL